MLLWRECCSGVLLSATPHLRGSEARQPELAAVQHREHSLALVQARGRREGVRWDQEESREAAAQSDKAGKQQPAKTHDDAFLRHSDDRSICVSGVCRD